MSRKKTHEEFVEEMQTVNPNIKIMSKYDGANKKVRCNCLICGNDWLAKPSPLLHKSGCPICGRKKANKKITKSHEQFVTEVSDKNPNVKIIGRYTNSKSKLKCLCKICNSEWMAVAEDLLLGHGCPICGRQKMIKKSTKSQETYLSELQFSHPNIKLVGKYINMSTPTSHQCSKCDYIWDMKPSKIYYSGEICPVCNNSVVKVGVNDLWTTHPEIAKMLKNPEDGYNNTSSSSKKVDWECQNCHSAIKNKRINYVVQYKLSCPYCADGISYPMKFVVSALKQLGINFDTEVTFKEWTFCFNNYNYKPRYDIVFENSGKKYIIEVDGGLHNRVYKSSKKSLEEVKYIDKMKTYLAKENGYVMIRIDCNESDMIYIKTSILSSKLNELFDFSYVDWEQCHKDALSSKVKEVCDYWNQLENPSVNKVFAELKLPRSTVQRWLKKGALAGMCNYDPFEERIKSNKYSKHKIYKKVVCLNTHTVYDSITKASEYYNITSGSISNACKGKISFAGRDSNTKEPLLWMYYKDYQKMSKSDIDSYIKSKIIKATEKHSVAKRIICLTTDKCFVSATEASNYYNISESGIRNCCKGKYAYSGHLDDGTKLIWMYLDDYNILNEEEKKNKLNCQHHNSRKVICVNTLEVFDSMKEAGEYYNVYPENISHCCRNNQFHTGVDNKTGEKLSWMYYEDYLREKEAI